MERCKLDYSHPYGRSRVLRHRSGDEVLPAVAGELTMLNWELLKNPLNWLIILVMLLIAGMAGHLLLSYAGLEPASSDNSQ